MLTMTACSSRNYETNIHEVNEVFNNISIRTDTADISFVPSDSETMKQRIFIHRVDSAIMPYCIESLDMSMADFSPRYNPHYGTDLQKALQMSGYSMKPELES